MARPHALKQQSKITLYQAFLDSLFDTNNDNSSSSIVHINWNRIYINFAGPGNNTVNAAPNTIPKNKDICPIWKSEYSLDILGSPHTFFSHSDLTFQIDIISLPGYLHDLPARTVPERQPGQSMPAVCQ